MSSGSLKETPWTGLGWVYLLWWVALEEWYRDEACTAYGAEDAFAVVAEVNEVLGNAR